MSEGLWWMDTREYFVAHCEYPLLSIIVADAGELWLAVTTSEFSRKLPFVQWGTGIGVLTLSADFLALGSKASNTRWRCLIALDADDKLRWMRPIGSAWKTCLGLGGAIAHVSSLPSVPYPCLLFPNPIALPLWIAKPIPSFGHHCPSTPSLSLPSFAGQMVSLPLSSSSSLLA